MEKALGAKLLERHRRGVVPSPTGWLLVAHARAIVGQLARMRTELARAADGLQSPLVVLANTSATQTLVPTALADFLATHSNIDVELQERPSHEIVAAVTDGRAELGIIADTVDSARLECTTLRPDRLVVIVPANHPLADRDQVTFSACLDYPFLGFTQGNPLQEHLSGQTQPLGLRPRYRAHLPSADAICAAVAAGVGNSGRPSFGRRPVVASRPARRRPDKRVGSPQSAVVLPRSAAIIQSCCRIQRASGISRMSDYPRDAPAQQLLLISAAPTEQPAIIDLNAAALHFGIPLGTTLGGVPVTRGVPAALISRTGLEASVMVLDSIARKR